MKNNKLLNLGSNTIIILNGLQVSMRTYRELSNYLLIKYLIIVYPLFINHLN